MKKVISRIEYGTEFMENQNGSKTIVFAERDKGESSQATERRWHMGWALNIKRGKLCWSRVNGGRRIPAIEQNVNRRA